jgi:hypothetical protein
LLPPIFKIAIGRHHFEREAYCFRLSYVGDLKARTNHSSRSLPQCLNGRQPRREEGLMKQQGARAVRGVVDDGPALCGKQQILSFEDTAEKKA